MTIMVLGGAGYIGSHTVYALIEKGEDVVIVDNLETGYAKAVHEKARFYQGDIRDRALLIVYLIKKILMRLFISLPILWLARVCVTHLNIMIIMLTERRFFCSLW